MAITILSCDFPDCSYFCCQQITDGDSIEITSVNDCYTYIAYYDLCQTSIGITLTNNTGETISIYVNGGVDDDVMFDGNVYEDGAYCFWSEDCPGGSTPCTYVNGAHFFSYNQILNIGQSIEIKGVDNGGGGAIHCNITFS
jgi:hypothetical protein